MQIVVGLVLEEIPRQQDPSRDDNCQHWDQSGANIVQFVRTEESVAAVIGVLGGEVLPPTLSTRAPAAPLRLVFEAVVTRAVAVHHLIGRAQHDAFRHLIMLHSLTMI